MKTIYTKLSGMNESTGHVDLPSAACDATTVQDKVYKAANVLQVYVLYTYKLNTTV